MLAAYRSTELPVVIVEEREIAESLIEEDRRVVVRITSSSGFAAPHAGCVD